MPASASVGVKTSQPLDRGAAGVSLVHQTPWIAPGGDAMFHLSLNKTGSTSALDIGLTVHQSISSRSQLTSTFDGRSLGTVLARVPSVPVESLRVDTSGNQIITIPTQHPDAPRDAGRLQLRGDGIYPVVVQLRDTVSGTTLDRFVTYLTVLDSSARRIPLRVATVWQFDATPAHAPNGELRRTTQDTFEGRLGRVLRGLETAGDTPVTIVPTPETVEAWQTWSTAQQPNVGDALKQAAAPTTQRQLLTSPYIGVDLPSLLGAGLEREADSQLARGTETLRELTVGPVDPQSLNVGRLDSPSIRYLRQRGVQRVLVDSSSVDLAQRFTPSSPFLLAESGRADQVTAAVSDQGLEAVLAEPAPSGLVATRYLASLAVIALERPGNLRGVVATTPRAWDPSTALVTDIVDGLRDHPLLLATTLDGFFDTVPLETTRGRPVVRIPRATPPRSKAIQASALQKTRRTLRSFATIVGGEQHAHHRAAERSLLISQASSRWAGDKAASVAREYLRGSQTLVDSTVGGILGPKPQTVTLIGRRARVPLSLVNTSSDSLRVEIRLQSDKLVFPDGARRVVELGRRNTTERFSVEARGSGNFPLFITVTSPDGSIEVLRTELTIRSTAVSGMGIILTTAAGLFLASWWGLHFRKVQRRRDLS